MNHPTLTITKKELAVFINNLIHQKTYDVVGPKAKGKRFAYGTLDDATDLRLDHDVTILPPKKYFLPTCEPLLNYNLKKSFDAHPKLDNQPRIIIGMHPYDLIALQQTDKVYTDYQKDDFYQKRRANTIIIASDIENVSDRSFAASMETSTVTDGYDLLLTTIGTGYAITIGTDKGKKLLDKHATTKKITPADLKKISNFYTKLPTKYKRTLKTPKENWPKLLAANHEHAIWEEKADRCMECSSCTLVCPTCYCYDVRDTTKLNLTDGERYRTWDGCMLKDFGKIGSGEVFRKDVKDRYRHRFYRKGNYLPARYDYVACVGCGRCGIACLPDIADPCELFNELSRFATSDNTDRYFIRRQTKAQEKNTIHIPRPATIKKIQRLTPQETLYELELNDKKPLGHKPGQFVEISVFGIGEAPFCVSSAPSNNPIFEIVVRKVGSVTNKLAGLSTGDIIGVRGPLGVGFDVKAYEKKDLIFTSGGIGIFPMRSLINYVLAPENRPKYKSITILYGAKKPSEVLFLNEINEWKKSPNTQVELTVDRCDATDCWVGCTGLITTLFPKVETKKLDVKTTIAVVIGPPIMYKFVIKCLQTIGITDDNIYVSLERRMKCGVAKCGHCQMNGVYVCKEGPVFNNQELKALPEAFE
jgi:NAD(P)H-flavin reductase/formate hydrogenlyase subunit 6/NADH:ubiquinone oxidoreductase subunit I